MAWGEKNVLEERRKFIAAVDADIESFAALCRHFSISRTTGYKWLDRHEEEGDDGLHNKSSAPLIQANKTDPDIERRILELKYEFLSWGPKKLLPKLVERYPREEWPSTTTIGNILHSKGLVIPRKYRKRVPGRTAPLIHCQQANDVWCTDFKGWFVTGDGQKCEPFTLTDGHTRFLLRCLPLAANDAQHVWAIMDMAFREFGLPLFLRNDNGAPFGSCGVGRLTRLSVKLIKAGVTPEWIDPGQPQQNGRHERMHQTLKKETASPPEPTFDKQKDRLKEFLIYFNFERPHEALGQVTPGSVYGPSPRSWHGRLKSPEYPSDYIVRRVKSCGKLSWKMEELYIGGVLANEPIGLKAIEDGGFTVYYGPIVLGEITIDKEFIYPEGKKRKR